MLVVAFVYFVCQTISNVWKQQL